MWVDQSIIELFSRRFFSLDCLLMLYNMKFIFLEDIYLIRITKWTLKNDLKSKPIPFWWLGKMHYIIYIEHHESTGSLTQGASDVQKETYSNKQFLL